MEFSQLAFYPPGQILLRVLAERLSDRIVWLLQSVSYHHSLKIPVIYCNQDVFLLFICVYQSTEFELF